jgi:hypothetical protein
MVSTLDKTTAPKEPGYTPSTPAPCDSLGKRLSDKTTLLINWLSQSHVDCGVLFSWVVLHVPFKIYDLVLIITSISYTYQIIT